MIQNFYITVLLSSLDLSYNKYICNIFRLNKKGNGEALLVLTENIIHFRLLQVL